MDSDAKMNKLLLNAMFALNEAGDELDEIYRIGLETAVSLLNANSGCMFKRDDWDDNKWSVVRLFQFDKQIAEKIANSPLLSRVANNGNTQNSMEFIDWYQNERVATPDAIIVFPIKLFKWSKWVLQIELENQSTTTEKSYQQTVNYCHQFGLILERIFSHEELKHEMQMILFEIRNTLGIIYGCSQFLLKEEDDLLSPPQRELLQLIFDSANRTNTFLHPRILYYPVHRSGLENINSKTIQNEILKSYPNTSINFPIEFTLQVDEFNFLNVIQPIFEKPIERHIKSFSDPQNAKLTIECFFEDLSLTDEGISELEPYQLNSIMLKKHDWPIQTLKTYINYMGGQFKISTEAGKGYTLTITFPIVTEDANE